MEPTVQRLPTAGRSTYRRQACLPKVGRRNPA